LFFKESLKTQAYLNTGKLSKTLAQRFTDFFARSTNKTYFCGVPFGKMKFENNVENFVPQRIQIESKKLECSGFKEYASLNILIISFSFLILFFKW
jgi:hypothetical protein